jgi:serine/threonine protein phosphatase PrpC
MHKPILDVFAKVDNELRLLDADGCGSTACVCVIRVEQGERNLYTANLGDSRAVLYSSMTGKAMRLTNDHTPKN